MTEEKVWKGKWVKWVSRLSAWYIKAITIVVATPRQLQTPNMIAWELECLGISISNGADLSWIRYEKINQ